MQHILKSRSTVVAASVAALVAVVMMIEVAGSGATKTRNTRASDVDRVVAQVKSQLGDGRIAEATVAGSTISVTLNAPDAPSAALARWDGKVLAVAVSQQLASDGQDAIDSATYSDTSGTDLNGATDAVSHAQPVIALSPNSCEEAARSGASAGVAVASARTVPLIGGACMFTVHVADVSSFDANASNLIGAIAGGIPDVADHAYVFDIVDAKGATQMVLGWIPGIGPGSGQGVAWLPSGARSSAVLGSTIGASVH
jgi:hypothetical protein